MERAEAIYILKNAAWLGTDKDREETEQAVDMAIEALSAEQKEEDLAKDIARRMATIIENEQDMRVILESANQTELLNDRTLKVNVKNGADVNRVLVWGDDGFGGLYYADDRQSGEWIPCSERLPSKDGCYLVTTTGTNNCIIDIAYYTDEIWHKASRIKAWMPLPKPYCPNCGAKMGGE
jgi:hypothetical protein